MKKRDHKFAFALTRWHGGTIMKIHKQPEEWRGKGDLFLASNDVNICSSEQPEISTGIYDLEVEAIYIRGRSKGCDNDIIAINCTTEEHYRILQALRELQAWSDAQPDGDTASEEQLTV